MFSLESDPSKKKYPRGEIGGYGGTMIGWGGSRLCREWELIPPRGIGEGTDSGEESERERGGGEGKCGKIKGGHAGYWHGKHVRVTCVSNIDIDTRRRNT